MARAGRRVIALMTDFGTSARVVPTYGAGKSGALIAVVGSTGYVELALREGSAARRYRARRGEPVELCHIVE